MSKEEDIKFLKIQTCVLKVNIHCDGCKQKVKKLLQKIDGVYTTTIDAEQGKVTVSGNVDPAILIKKLVKNGKHAELLAPKLNNNKNQQQFNNQFQKLQLDNGKGGQKDNGKGGQKDNGDKGVQKGGGGNNNQKGQEQQQQLHALQQQMKGFDLGRLNDLKMPFMKDPKSVKFNIPEDDDEGSDFDDEFDDEFDDDDYDDFDGSDDDFEEDLKQIKTIKPMNGGMPVGNVLVNDKKGGGGGGGNGGNNEKKGGAGGGDVSMQNKGVVGGNDGKNGNPNGKKGGGGGGQNGGKNGNGGQDGKNGGGNNSKGGGVPNNNPGVKKGGKNEMSGGNNPHSAMTGGGIPAGMNMMPLQMGGGGGGSNFSMHPMAHTGNTATAVQGLPANGGIPQGCFPGGPGMPPPGVIAAGNPYQQQQYIAAMMQQQRMMMNGPDRTFQPTGYAQPPVPINYMPPQPEYTHFFSDENTSSCSIM